MSRRCSDPTRPLPIGTTGYPVTCTRPTTPLPLCSRTRCSSPCKMGRGRGSRRRSPESISATSNSRRWKVCPWARGARVEVPAQSQRGEPRGTGGSPPT
uniref:Uncharacterized protein n=1 Tax=Arundo donax TaxID=35708 RepID=A0A0A9EM21_ARUDO